VEPIVVGAFPKNKAEAVAGEISEFQGRVYAHIRVYRATLDGGFLPTSKGVAMPLKCVNEVRAAVHALCDVMGPNRVTGEVDVGRERIRIGTRSFEGSTYLDIRRYFRKGSDGEWLPTTKGLMVRPELLDSLLNLVDELAVAADEASRGV
jgi:hypothetical protein